MYGLRLRNIVQKPRSTCSRGSVAEWSARRNRNPAVPGSSSALTTYLDLFHGSSEFKSSATLANSQLVCLRPVWILNNVMFKLNYVF